MSERRPDAFLRDTVAWLLDSRRRSPLERAPAPRLQARASSAVIPKIGHDKRRRRRKLARGARKRNRS